MADETGGSSANNLLVDKLLSRLNRHMQDPENGAEVTERLLNHIARNGLDGRVGARWLSRLVEDEGLAALLRAFSRGEWNGARFQRFWGLQQRIDSEGGDEQAVLVKYLRSHNTDKYLSGLLGDLFSGRHDHEQVKRAWQALRAPLDPEQSEPESHIDSLMVNLKHRWLKKPDLAAIIEPLLQQVVSGHMDAHAAARWLSGWVDDESLSSVLRAFARGELEPDSFERLWSLYKRIRSEDGDEVKALARHLRGMVDSKQVKGFLTVLFDDQLNESKIESLLQQLVAEHLDAHTVARWLSGWVEDASLASLLRAFARGELEAESFETLWSLYKRIQSEDGDEVKALARHLRGMVDNKEVQGVLSLVVEGQLDQQSSTNLLSRLVGDPTLAAMLRAYGSGTLQKEALKKAWGLVKRIEAENGNEVVALARHLRQIAGDRFLSSILGDFLDGTHDPARLQNVWRLYQNASVSEDGMATIADAHWINEKDFENAYYEAKAISVWGHDIRWRVYTLISCAKHSAQVPGDFVECGVDRGGTAMAVMRHCGDACFAARRFYLFDTFQGLSEAQLSEQERETTRITEARYPDVYGQVQDTFGDKAFVEIVRGTVPDTLDAFHGESVAYLHIDMNVSYPECAAFEFFWPYLSKGAPVIFDDYGFPFHAPQRVALDQIAKKLGTSIMMLPTGQGITWKT